VELSKGRIPTKLRTHLRKPHEQALQILARCGHVDFKHKFREHLRADHIEAPGGILGMGELNVMFQRIFESSSPSICPCIDPKIERLCTIYGWSCIIENVPGYAQPPEGASADR
jgi:hypothetical protein